MKIIVDTKDAASVQELLAFLAILPSKDLPSLPDTVAEEETDLSAMMGGDDDDVDLAGMLSDGGEEEGGLESLLAEEEELPSGPTLEDMTAAFQACVAKHGKELAIPHVQDCFKRLKVNKMSDIPEDKRQPFINAIEKFVPKKK